MIYGIGTDIVLISRIDSILLKYGSKFADKILTVAELQEYQTAQNLANFLAKRFAAKEAVAKALGTGVTGFWFTDINISHNKHGKPLIILSGKCEILANSLQITHLHLSLSDEKHHILAFVIAECCH